MSLPFKACTRSGATAHVRKEPVSSDGAKSGPQAEGNQGLKCPWPRAMCATPGEKTIRRPSPFGKRYPKARMVELSRFRCSLRCSFSCEGTPQSPQGDDKDKGSGAIYTQTKHKQANNVLTPCLLSIIAHGNDSKRMCSHHLQIGIWASWMPPREFNCWPQVMLSGSQCTAPTN